VTDLLLGLVILLLAGVLVFLIVLAKRRREGDSHVENELKSQVAVLAAQASEAANRAAACAAQADERQGRITALEGRARESVEQLTDEIGARRAAEASLAAERANLAEQKALLDEAQEKLQNAFKALSADALRSSNEQFLSQADEKLKPIRDLLGTYELHLREIEKVRSDAYGGLKAHLDTLARSQEALTKETHTLSTALKSPTVRGQWGEMTLKRVVEVAGMSPHCDFDEQVTAVTGDLSQRPDMIIRLPGKRMIVVDSKVPLAAYMDAIEAKDEAGRLAAIARHAADVRRHVQALSSKSYSQQFPQSPDFVVMFLPAESLFSAALEQDRSLMQKAMESKVFLATPTTLMALLSVVAHGWHQQDMAENAEKIGAAGKDLYDRVAKFVDHFGRVGDGLHRAAKAYDDAVGSYQSRVQPAARRLAEQAALGDKELADLPVVDGPSRALPDAAEPPAE